MTTTITDPRGRPGPARRLHRPRRRRPRRDGQRRPRRPRRPARPLPRAGRRHARHRRRARRAHRHRAALRAALAGQPGRRRLRRVRRRERHATAMTPEQAARPRRPGRPGLLRPAACSSPSGALRDVAARSRTRFRTGAGLRLARARRRPVRRHRAVLPARLRRQPRRRPGCPRSTASSPSSSAGARVADVGCGHGASTILMAQAFPTSTFVGADYHEGSIVVARRRAAEAGVADRVTFEVADAAAARRRRLRPGDDVRLPARHGRPGRRGPRHVRASLAPDGTLMLVEPTAGDRVEDNLNPLGRVFYGASTLSARPARSPSPVGARSAPRPARRALPRCSRRRLQPRPVAAETPVNLVFEARRLTSRPPLDQPTTDTRRRNRHDHHRHATSSHRSAPPSSTATPTASSPGTPTRRRRDEPIGGLVVRDRDLRERLAALQLGTQLVLGDPEIGGDRLAREAERPAAEAEAAVAAELVASRPKPPGPGRAGPRPRRPASSGRRPAPSSAFRP